MGRKNIDSLQGKSDEDTSKAFFEAVKTISIISESERIQTKVMDTALKALREGDLHGASELLYWLYACDSLKPINNRDIMFAGLAYCTVFFKKNLDFAREQIQEIPEERLKDLDVFSKGLHDKTLAEITRHFGHQNLEQSKRQPKAMSPEEQAFLARLASDPKDIVSRFAYTKWLYEQERFEESQGHWLEVISQDRAWNQAEVESHLAKVFKKLGTVEMLKELRDRIKKS